MADRPFVHLHCHTHYSLLDGASRIPELVQHVKTLGMNAVAMTDHGNLYGAIEFYRECQAAGLNPVIGYEAYVAPNRRTDREPRRASTESDDAIYHHLTLLARDLTGFKNLIKMSSLAFLEGYHYKPRIDKELLEAHSEGVICLSGCAAAEFSDYILRDRLDEARKVAEWFARLFKDRFYVEIQNNGLEIQRLCAEGAIDIANQLGLPLVATSDAHYLKQDDWVAHDVLLCINTGRLRSNPKRFRFEGNQFHIRGPEEMYALFPAHPDAVKRSQEIANRVAIEIDFKKRHFPVFTPPAGRKPEDYLRELAEQGLRERYRGNPPPAARARFEHELGIITRMGFASYFLIVWDFVRFALENGIPASARGSACGALISYVLKLSHVDPLEYDLLFERFLDPNRSEAPDIDIDFCQERREQVIAYVKQKYGEESVAQIATFGTLGAKQVLKDVGRVLDVPLARVTQLTNWVPRGLHVSIDDTLRESPEFREAYTTDPQVKELVDIAQRLEGTNRQAGIHAAGVVIANGPLTDYVPVHRAVRKGEDTGRGGEVAVATQWVMGDLEKVGLLKMDFLGLRTLTLVENALQLIAKTRGHKIDIQNLPLDDPETFALLQRGDAKGVFQFESDGIRELLKRLRPDNIRDIIACTALYRPGPLGGGMVDMYINCKHGREQPHYAHPIMEEVLAETYGVMCYQEQVMRILNRLGGIELSSAYACIKAISKKKQEIIDQRKAEFLKGAVERGVDDATAKDIFDKIVYFGGYGFNKCVVAETELIDAATGERTTVGSLFESRRPFAVHALGEDGKLRSRRVLDVMWNGRKEVFTLATAQGKTITASGNHPFRTLDGWTNLDDLKPGDLIATPRQIAVCAQGHWPRHELVTLAGLLSEGNTCHPTCLYFFNDDPLLIADFADAVALFPDTAARISRRRDVRMEVCASTGQDRRFRKGMKPWNALKDEAEPPQLTRPEPIRSGAYRWAERLGILGRKATDKAIPAVVFRLCDEDLELFLGRLWAGDGFIANDDLFVPFYATSSRRLARDVQTLLLRLGILSGVHYKEFKYRGQMRPGYTVHLLGEGSIEQFLQRVTPHCLGREKNVELLRQRLQTVQRGLVSKDTIPAAVRKWVDEERRSAGLTWVELERHSGVSMKEFQGRGSPHKRGFRRSTIARLACYFGSRRLGEISRSDVFWDEIVSIVPAGVQDTYDLTVDVDHNFVADGLIVHNSHSAAYAYISYQTAYLKAHYTPEFMAALLTSEIDDGNKRDILVEHFDDAKKLGHPVQPPNVNTCYPDFTVVNGQILFGLVAIKGLGRGAAEAIVRARQEQGPFHDLFDFCERIDVKLVSKAAIEKIIKAGAMDCFGARRAQLWHVLPRALQSASQLQTDRKHGQLNLFETLDGSDAPADGAGAAEALPEVEEWPPAEKLKYEKEALDFYVSSHPLAQYDDMIQLFSSHRAGSLRELENGQEVLIGGMLTLVRFMNTKKARNGNSRYARFKLEDFSGIAECVMWPDDYVRYKDLVEEDRICFVGATVEKTREEPGLLVNRILTIEQAQKERTTGVVLALRLAEHGPGQLDQVARILQRARGSVPVFLYVRDAVGKQMVLKAADLFRVNPANLARGELEAVLGPGTVHFSRQGNGRNGR